MTPEKSNNKKTILIISLAVIVAVLIGAGLWSLKKPQKPEEKTVKPTIGQIDRDKVMKTKGFEKVNQDITKIIEEAKVEFETMTKDLDEKNPEDRKKVQKMREEFQVKLKAKTDKAAEPLIKLQKKAETAVAVVAVEKKINTVLDKTVVVTGAVDITDDVIKKLESSETIKMPDEATLKNMDKNSRIGYFDKSVILSLKPFNEVKEKLASLAVEKEAEFKKEVKEKNLNEQQQMELYRRMVAEIQKTEADLNAPLFRQINRIVRNVAEESKLDLVINKEHVMYGGKNITGEVAEEFSGK